MKTGRNIDHADSGEPNAPTYMRVAGVGGVEDIRQRIMAKLKG